MLGLVFAIISALFIAFSQIFLKKSYKELAPSVAFLFDSIFGLLIWLPLALFMGISGTLDWREAFLFAVISAILSEAVVFYALSHGELAVTATVLATYPVYTIIFSRLFNNEILSPLLYVFIGLAIAGSLVASAPEKGDFKINRGVVWPFIAAVSIGLSDTFSKGYINRSGNYSFLFALSFIQVPVAIAYLRLEEQSLTNSIKGVFKEVGDYASSLYGGLFNIVGTGFLWLSFSFAPASIASPVTGVNGALTVLFSRLLLKERISLHKYLGIAIAFAGVIGIALLKTS